ncbi:MAG: hypothetical protein QXT13_12975 [Pyrobaculum sp.]
MSYTTLFVDNSSGFIPTSTPRNCTIVYNPDGSIDITCSTTGGRATVRCIASECLSTLSCQSANNCERITSSIREITIFDYSSVNRSAIVHTYMLAVNGNGCPDCFGVAGIRMRSILQLISSPMNILVSPGETRFDPALITSIFRYSSPDTAYLIKATVNNWITSRLNIQHMIVPSVGWVQSTFSVLISVPSSPELFMEVDYDEYRRSGLRNVVGWTASGRGKVGWNADDILRVLKEEFSDRPWALFDDKSMVLYTNLLSPESIVHVKDITHAERVEIIREGHHVLRIDGWYDLREE